MCRIKERFREALRPRIDEVGHFSSFGRCTRSSDNTVSSFRPLRQMYLLEQNGRKRFRISFWPKFQRREMFL